MIDSLQSETNRQKIVSIFIDHDYVREQLVHRKLIQPILIRRKVPQTIDNLDHTQLELISRTHQKEINEFQDRLILYLAPTYERDMYKFVKMNYQTNFTNQIANAADTGDKLKGGT